VFVKERLAASPEDEFYQLEEWMQLYGTDVINMAYSYVKNYHQAQDIAQDVFLKAFQKRDTFRGDSSVKTWLLSITVNRCKDFLRSWSVRHEVKDEKILTRELSSNSTEDEVIARLERDSVWKIIVELPPKYREVVVLYYLRGFSGQEIAQVLNTSEQNVRTRLHRGRAMLKKLLEEGN
jgi:RNA polymerase sigma-70 factor (ECF subfamily)